MGAGLNVGTPGRLTRSREDAKDRDVRGGRFALPGWKRQSFFVSVLAAGLLSVFVSELLVVEGEEALLLSLSDLLSDVLSDFPSDFPSDWPSGLRPPFL